MDSPAELMEELITENKYYREALEGIVKRFESMVKMFPLTATREEILQSALAGIVVCMCKIALEKREME